jgi:hypothetical protein
MAARRARSPLTLYVLGHAQKNRVMGGYTLAWEWQLVTANDAMDTVAEGRLSGGNIPEWVATLSATDAVVKKVHREVRAWVQGGEFSHARASRGGASLSPQTPVHVHVFPPAEGHAAGSRIHQAPLRLLGVQKHKFLIVTVLSAKPNTMPKQSKLSFTGTLTQAKAAAKKISQTKHKLVELHAVGKDGWPVMIGMWRGHDEGDWSPV